MPKRTITSSGMAPKPSIIGEKSFTKSSGRLATIALICATARSRWPVINAA